ncbi:MAG: hypothetical protein KGJ41_12320 [Rhodospirillales bacterium]|nr:hypothetical protein [Rhodospirillales bacterium]MDE2199795.1 hypothetical protein [Rhodospirillales bacterium]MDE2574153.1 hypothetical protein [Rhodospirillales bacterium]
MSEPAHPPFRRLILRLENVEPTPQMARAAGQFAHLLGLHLHSIFLVDEAVFGLAQLPFTRELRLPGHEWHPLDPDRLAAELDQAASRAQRIVSDAVHVLGLNAAFEVVRGDPASCLSAFRDADDILAVMASATAQVGSHRPFRNPLDSLVLVLPAHPAEWQGPIAIVLDGAGGPALPLAARLAIAADAGLLLFGVTPAVLDAGLSHASALGVPKERVTTRLLSAMEEEAIVQAARNSGSRLLVASRSITTDDPEAVASRLARATDLPVLLA